MKLAVDPPEDNMVTDLAPRVQVIYYDHARRHEWGYALCLTSLQMVRVLFDEPGFEGVTVEDIPCEYLLFKL